jgi:hypothetical protein
MSPETNNPSQPRGFDVQAASRFEYEIGNEHSPTDPFGRQHVVVFSGDRFEYTVYKKQGRLERLSGSLRAGSFKTLCEHLAESAFPNIDHSPIPMGGAYAAYRLEVEGNTLETRLVYPNTARSEPGLSALQPLMDQLTRAFSDGDVQQSEWIASTGEWTREKVATPRPGKRVQTEAERAAMGLLPKLKEGMTLRQAQLAHHPSNPFSVRSQAELEFLVMSHGFRATDQWTSGGTVSLLAVDAPWGRKAFTPVRTHFLAQLEDASFRSKSELGPGVSGALGPMAFLAPALAFETAWGVLPAELVLAARGLTEALKFIPKGQREIPLHIFSEPDAAVKALAKRPDVFQQKTIENLVSQLLERAVAVAQDPAFVSVRKARTVAYFRIGNRLVRCDKYRTHTLEFELNPLSGSLELSEGLMKRLKAKGDKVEALKERQFTRFVAAVRDRLNVIELERVQESPAWGALPPELDSALFPVHIWSGAHAGVNPIAVRTEREALFYLYSQGIQVWKTYHRGASMSVLGCPRPTGFPAQMKGLHYHFVLEQPGWVGVGLGPGHSALLSDEALKEVATRVNGLRMVATEILQLALWGLIEFEKGSAVGTVISLRNSLARRLLHMKRDPACISWGAALEKQYVEIAGRLFRLDKGKADHNCFEFNLEKDCFEPAEDLVSLVQTLGAVGVAPLSSVQFHARIKGAASAN